MASQCPVQVPGVTTSVVDTQRGAALVFVTKTGDVADLRERTKKMAEWHNLYGPDGGAMMGGHGRHGMMGGGYGMTGHGGHGMMGHGMMMMVAATVSAEDVEGGARLEFIPKNPAELATLRTQVRERAARMASGECPMSMHRQEGRTPPPASS